MKGENSWGYGLETTEKGAPGGNRPSGSCNEKEIADNESKMASRTTTQTRKHR